MLLPRNHLHAQRRRAQAALRAGISRSAQVKLAEQAIFRHLDVLEALAETPARKQAWAALSLVAMAAEQAEKRAWKKPGELDWLIDP